MKICLYTNFKQMFNTYTTQTHRTVKYIDMYIYTRARCMLAAVVRLWFAFDTISVVVIYSSSSNYNNQYTLKRVSSMYFHPILRLSLSVDFGVCLLSRHIGIKYLVHTPCIFFWSYLACYVLCFRFWYAVSLRNTSAESSVFNDVSANE